MGKKTTTKAAAIQKIIKLVQEHPDSFPEKDFKAENLRALVKHWEEFIMISVEVKKLKDEYKQKREEMMEMAGDIEENIRPLKKFVRKESKYFQSLKTPKKDKIQLKRVKAK